FDLYATWGFPRDLVEQMAREDGLTVDRAGWDRAEAKHREASRSQGFGMAFDMREIEGLAATKNEFYRESNCDGLRSSSRPIKMIGDDKLILETSPFYAESGGQVGDSGAVVAEGFRFRVDDTQRYGDVVVLHGVLEQGNPESLPSTLTAEVDVERRRAVMRNHTATHLLHWALHQVLGDDATQQGSLVAEDRLRFDLTHPKGITPDE
ncbi:MAG: alanine--tRNA ligase, partial [Rhodocyclaceae bacterium]|nr:alanine--tRNA ligase [Rhodocyclaceae bacterium]